MLLRYDSSPLEPGSRRESGPRTAPALLSAAFPNFPPGGYAPAQQPSPQPAAQPYGFGSPANVPQQYAPPPTERLSGVSLVWAIIGMAVLSLAFWPAALVLGTVLLFAANRRYRTVGIAGTILGAIGLVLSIVVLVLIVSIGSDNETKGTVNSGPSVSTTKVLDHNAVAQSIEQQSNGQYTNVQCPSTSLRAGATFQCTADGGKKINVTIRDSNGNYVWSSAN